jgi:hypothetical protein
MKLAILSILSIVVLAACSNRPADEDTETSRPAPLTGARPRHMRNCPSAVPTATTRAERTPDGIDLVITSSDPAARQRITELANLHVAMSVPLWLIPQHSGLHGGPEAIGFCPIIHDDTTVTADQLANGVRVHVAAHSPLGALIVQRETERRLGAIQRPST